MHRPFATFFILSEFKPLAWGFGAQPQMETQSQSKDNAPN